MEINMGLFFDKYPELEYDFLNNGQYQKIPDILKQVRDNKININKSIAYRWVDVAERRPDQLSFDLYGSPNYHWTFFIINEQIYRGDRGWPFSSEGLRSYVNKKYNYSTIRLYRSSTDDLYYNSIADKFTTGTTITGKESQATGTIVSRLSDMNTICFQYSNTKAFLEGEIITCSDGTEIKDKYDIRTGINTIRYWYDIKREYNHFNYDNLDITGSAEYTFTTNLEYEQERNESLGRIKIIRPEIIEEFAAEYRRLINE